MQNYSQYGSQAPQYYSVGATQQGNPTTSYTSTGTGATAAASTFSYSMAPNPVTGGYASSYGMNPMPSYGMTQSYTASGSSGLCAPAGLQVPGLIQAPSAAVAAAGPFKFYATPVQEAISEGSPMAASPVSVCSQGSSIAIGTPASPAGMPVGFAVPQTIGDPLALPTVAALGGPSPVGSFQSNPVGSFQATTPFGGSVTSYQGSLPGTTENMVPASCLALPTEAAMSGVDPGYIVPVSGSGTSFPMEPGSPITAPGTQEVLADAPLPGWSSMATTNGPQSPQGAGSPVRAANVIPATAPGGLCLPKVQAPVLQVGMSCIIAGLNSLPGAPNLNGMVVTLVSCDTAKDKWVVQAADGNKARVPSAALSPVPRQS